MGRWRILRFLVLPLYERQTVRMRRSKSMLSHRSPASSPHRSPVRWYLPDSSFLMLAMGNVDSQAGTLPAHAAL